MPPKMDMPEKRKVGRPRKEAGEGTEKQQKQREYMRKYMASINEGIKELAKDEDECLQHLDRILKEKKKLFDDLDKANAQLLGLLNERLKKP
jgi:septal ring factor EnvC (AmiA/AmiB activator)